MEAIITDSILKHSLINKEVGKNIINALFSVNYDLPEKVYDKRPSFVGFNNVMKWGGKVESAHIASLTTLNSKHGCFHDAYELIKVYFSAKNNPESFLFQYLTDKFNQNPVPGFGSPVYKGTGSDERCLIVRNSLPPLPVLDAADKIIKTVKLFTEKDIDANIVFWNAFAIYCLGLSKHYASLIFILATQIRYINELTQPSYK